MQRERAGRDVQRAATVARFVLAKGEVVEGGVAATDKDSPAASYGGCVGGELCAILHDERAVGDVQRAAIVVADVVGKEGVIYQDGCGIYRCQRTTVAGLGAVVVKECVGKDVKAAVGKVAAAPCDKGEVALEGDTTQRE